MDVEKLGRASIHAHTFALVEIGFAVIVGDALLRAICGQAERMLLSKQLRGDEAESSRKGLAVGRTRSNAARDVGTYRDCILVMRLISVMTAEIFSSDDG